MIIKKIWNIYKPILLIASIVVFVVFFLTLGLYIVFLEWSWDVPVGVFFVSCAIGLGFLLVADHLHPSAILTFATDETIAKSVSEQGEANNSGSEVKNNTVKHEIEIQYAGVRMCLKDQLIPLQVRLFFPRKGEYDIYIRVDNYEWMKVVDLNDEIPRIDVPIKMA